jgi:glycosyltransferase involved in cell wall biosynthesis
MRPDGLTKTLRFSIVIPVYNRPEQIGRAIRSCQAQTFRDFEAVVVDDASKDRTAKAVAACNQDGVAFIQHRTNRGVCAARNTGVRHARGEWIVFLDSDDELLPDALMTMDNHIRELPRSIDRIGFSYIHPDGSQSPTPTRDATILDYAGYLRWAEAATRSDFNNCIRRSTFDAVRLPEGRVYERLYHLDFARNFRTLLLPDMVARVHDDAPNRLTNSSLRNYVRKKRAEASDGANSIVELLARHGNALQTLAPNTFQSLSRQKVEMLLLAGQRREGLRTGLAFLKEYPRAASGWAMMAAGLLGPAPLAALNYAASRLRV